MVKSKEEIQKVKILMDKVIEQTDEIDRCRERVAQLGRDRRELFSVLRLHGKTYRELAEATGLHQVTIQQNMGIEAFTAGCRCKVCVSAKLQEMRDGSLSIADPDSLSFTKHQIEQMRGYKT